jgi:serine/threonine-protein kinase
MAELYLAKDTRSNRMVVLKRILPYLAEEADFLSMFLDEARIAAQLHHPNIVEVFELGRLDGSTFICMEWVDGIDLRKLLQKEQSINAVVPPPIAAWIIARLCDGLHHAHERVGPDGRPLGIIHRDVSPQNVMVTYRGEVKLVDFGIAKATAWMSRSKPGVIKGKFLYLAPEQLTQEKLDLRADLFALGTLLYELTIGKTPFQRSTTEAVIYAIRMEDPTEPVKVIDGYPVGLSRIVMRCLEKERERRYQSASQVRDALDAYLAAGANTQQDDVVRYIASLFGDENERTSVYVPPNARSKPPPVVPMPARVLPSLANPFGNPEEEPTKSMPHGVPASSPVLPVGRSPTREAALTEPEPTDKMGSPGRDRAETQPYRAPKIAGASVDSRSTAETLEAVHSNDSRPTLSLPPPEEPSIHSVPTGVAPSAHEPNDTPSVQSGPVQLGTGDVVLPVSENSPPSPSMRSPIVTPDSVQAESVRANSRALIVTPVSDSKRRSADETSDPPKPTAPNAAMPPRLQAVEAPLPAALWGAPPNVRAPKAPGKRRPAAQALPIPTLDPDDAIDTANFAKFDSRTSRAQGQRQQVPMIVIIAVLSTLATASMIWALLPARSPNPPERRTPELPRKVEEPKPPARIKVSFAAPPGTRISVGGTAVAAGQTIEVSPGPLTVNYVCPSGRPKHKARTFEAKREIPSTSERFVIELTCPS